MVGSLGEWTNHIAACVRRAPVPRVGSREGLVVLGPLPHEGDSIDLGGIPHGTGVNRISRNWREEGRAVATQTDDEKAG